MIVEALTDNRNRTAADVRHTFAKHGGNLGTTGAVAWQFERRGVVVVRADGVDEDELSWPPPTAARTTSSRTAACSRSRRAPEQSPRSAARSRRPASRSSRPG